MADKYPLPPDHPAWDKLEALFEKVNRVRIPVAVTFTDQDVIVALSDGSKISNPLSWHQWLERATPEQRSNMVYYAFSIDWPELDEGLDIEWMLRGGEPQDDTDAQG